MNKPKPKSRDNVLSPEEREQILKACETEEEKIVVYGLMFTGMRISEFLHMRKDWVNFDKNIISVPLERKCNCYECMAKKEHKGLFRVKTKHAERPIPLLSELKPLFESYFENHNTIMDTIWHRINAWRIVTNIGKKAGIKHKIFPHCIRATFATIMAEKGFDAFIIQRVLGWKKLSMAEEYVRMSSESITKEFQKKW